MGRLLLLAGVLEAKRPCYLLHVGTQKRNKRIQGPSKVLVTHLVSQVIQTSAMPHSLPKPESQPGVIIYQKVLR